MPGNLLTLFPEGDDDVPGVSTDFGFFGFARSITPMGKERRNLHSSNFLLWGATKRWLVVPASEGEKLETAIQQLCEMENGGYTIQCPQNEVCAIKLS